MHYSKQMDQIDPTLTAETKKGDFPNMWLYDLYPLLLLFSDNAVWRDKEDKS